jgi:hypothetical protein
MAYPIKRFLLTPREAAEKALIVDRIKTDSRSPLRNSKKMCLPKPKGATPGSKKK